MIAEIVELQNTFKSKPTWSSKELMNKCQSLSDKLSKVLGEDGKLVNIKGSGIPKLSFVNYIKKYDIVYVSVLGGMPHYYLVWKSDDKKVIGLCITSTYKESNHLHTIKNDRIFCGNYISNTLLAIELDDAKVTFVRTFEDKREAGRIFKKVTNFYNAMLNN